jgi:hypothetical protein
MEHGSWYDPGTGHLLAASVDGLVCNSIKEGVAVG